MVHACSDPKTADYHIFGSFKCGIADDANKEPGIVYQGRDHTVTECPPTLDVSQDRDTMRRVFLSGLADDPESRSVHHNVDVIDGFEATHKKLRTGHLVVHSIFSCKVSAQTN